MWNAVRDGYISSSKLWEGTSKKIVGYLVIVILAGLSIRVTPLFQIAVFLSTFVYSIMFLRESQSIIENLIEAGHSDLEWMLVWLRKKQKEVESGKKGKKS